LRTPDFGPRAASYDRLRPLDANWWELFELVVREADLHGRRVLDVGCGTGRLSRALAERVQARVWGVDPSPDMVEEARRVTPRGVGVTEGRAEALPFRDGWFDRLVLWLVVHLVDRPAAFAEARRVLGPEGTVAIVTFDASHFRRYWLNPYFPSLEAVDRARFPEREQLHEELRAAGFAQARMVRVSQRSSFSRKEAVARVRGRHISTFDLLEEEELRAGTERAAQELPERVDAELEWLIAVAGL
jgi:SAM-dependent methyltransferase